MSIYWKQSLLLGGMYWIISLILGYIDTFETYFTDFVLSLFLTIFLIPMNFIKPIKWLDKLMNKLPITTTFLIFVGWVPYLSILVFLIAMIYSIIAVFSGYVTIDGLILTLVTPFSVLTVVKVACILFSFVMASFYVFLNKKTFAGCLNNKFKLIEDDSCNMPIVEEAVAEQAKKMYECKKAVVKRKDDEKKMKVKKKEAQKAVRVAIKEKKQAEKAIKKKTSTK